MRADLDSPRTWLLAAVAGWAVLVLGLALSGMGGRIAPLPVDPTLANLPQPRPAAVSRIGPADQYVQVAARPAFDPGRRPHPFFIENAGGDDAARGFDFTLSSVLIAPGLRMVVLQPAGGGEALRVKLGQEPAGSPGWRLAEVGPRSAAFDGPEGRRTLELPVYAGNGQGPLPDVAQRVPAQGNAGPSPVAAPAVVPGTGNPSAAALVADAQAVLAGVEVTAAPERQLQQIRERIEARRAQLRQQQKGAASAPLPPQPQR